MGNFRNLTMHWTPEKIAARKKRAAELNVELDAFADYYERYGVKPQGLTPTERRKIIENYKEDHDESIEKDLPRRMGVVLP